MVVVMQETEEQKGNRERRDFEEAKDKEQSRGMMSSISSQSISGVDSDASCHTREVAKDHGNPSKMGTRRSPAKLKVEAKPEKLVEKM